MIVAKLILTSILMFFINPHDAQFSQSPSKQVLVQKESLTPTFTVIKVTGVPHRYKGTSKQGLSCGCNHCAGICDVRAWVFGWQVLGEGFKKLYLGYQSTGSGQGTLDIWGGDGYSFPSDESMIIDDITTFDGEIAAALGVTSITIPTGTYAYQSGIGSGAGGYSMTVSVVP